MDSPYKELTQVQKILYLMARSPKDWFVSEDFMQYELGRYFVGYEAHARLSELNKVGVVESIRYTRRKSKRALRYKLAYGIKDVINNLIDSNELSSLRINKKTNTLRF